MDEFDVPLRKRRHFRPLRHPCRSTRVDRMAPARKRGRRISTSRVCRLTPRLQIRHSSSCHRDGSATSLLILYAGGAVFFATTAYFALDQAFGITSLFYLSRSSAAERDLANIALMLLGVLWPYL